MPSFGHLPCPGCLSSSQRDSPKSGQDQVADEHTEDISCAQRLGHIRNHDTTTLHVLLRISRVETDQHQARPRTYQICSAGITDIRVIGPVTKSLQISRIKASEVRTIRICAVAEIDVKRDREVIIIKIDCGRAWLFLSGDAGEESRSIQPSDSISQHGIAVCIGRGSGCTTSLVQTPAGQFVNQPLPMRLDVGSPGFSPGGIGTTY